MPLYSARNIMRSVLFFSVSIGAGHDLAAQGVIEEIKYRYPGCLTRTVDTYKYINPVLSKVIVGGYMETLKFNPKIWGHLYEQAEEGDVLVDLSHILSKLASVKMEKLIKEFEPQAIVCTHAFPAGILSLLKGREKFKVPLVGILTDYTVHPFWINAHIDKYILPCEDLTYQMAAHGVPPEKILPAGIPLRRQFAERIEKTEARKNLGLQDITTVLVMGGGLGLGEIDSIIKNLGEADVELQIIAVTGKNDKLRTRLQLISTANPVRVYGYVDNMAEIMSASDFIITKPGGLTTAEVLARRLPMIIVDPLPGQEYRNTEFLLNSGVAVKVRNLRYLVPQLKLLLSNTTRVNQIREITSIIGKPEAARVIVDYLESVIEDR